MRRSRDTLAVAAIMFAAIVAPPGSVPTRAGPATAPAAGDPESQAGGNLVVFSGDVFLDANGNGRKDDAETPLANIHVSDGADIVTTDTAGRFSFSFDLEVPTCVFVIVPSGHRPSGPFYRVASPGQHDYSFGLVEDTGSQDGSFSFIAGGDIQFAFTKHEEQLSYYLKQLDDIEAAYGTSFSVWPGDLTP